MALESESKNKKCQNVLYIDKFYATHKPSMEENMHYFLDELSITVKHCTLMVKILSMISNQYNYMYMYKHLSLTIIFHIFAFP